MQVGEAGAILFPEESYRIMGACFAVYRELGCGFLEAVYHEALSIGFGEFGIPFTSRQPLPVTYRGNRLRQGYAADFFLHGRTFLEIKACSALCPEHMAQTLNYLKASDTQLGLLVNFGAYPKLEFKRVICDFGRYRF